MTAEDTENRQTFPPSVIRGSILPPKSLSHPQRVEERIEHVAEYN